MGVLLSFEVNPTTESTTFLPFSVTPYDIRSRPVNSNILQHIENDANGAHVLANQRK